MVYEIVALERRTSESKGRGSSSNRVRTPSDSMSNHLDTPTPCPLCGEVPTRDQDLKRHILDFHLPDWICCPHPDCSWHGSRKEMLYKHLNSKKCGAKPKWVEEYEIYDTELILHQLLIDSVPFEAVEKLVLGLIEERARELKKVDAWGPLAKWRKQTSQVLVEDVWVENDNDLLYDDL